MGTLASVGRSCGGCGAPDEIKNKTNYNIGIIGLDNAGKSSIL
jgi:GTPase SAR1 family protein